MVLVVLVVLVVLAVLVVSGVQHVDRVTFSTSSVFLNEPCNKRKRKKREREREKEKEKEKRKGTRERKREREEEEEEEEEEEKNRLLCKRCFFLLLAPGSALEKFAAIVNPENKPTNSLMAQCLGNVWKNCSLIRV